LRDNPALAPERRNATIAPAVNPYNWQEHLYSKNQPENLDFLKRLRAVMEPYGAAAVGEVGDAQYGLEILGQYTKGNDLMHMCYAFELLSGDAPTATRVAKVFADFDAKAPEGWACWAYSNHDVVRHISRWHLSDKAARAYTTLMMCLRGSVCLYQGEELGLTEAEVAFEDLQDPYGIKFWPEFKGRDGCRTPMVWRADNGNGGFTQGKSWLPVAPEHLGKALDKAESDPTSLLHFYRTIIALRHAEPALMSGDQTPVKATGSVVHFTRAGQIFCAVNLSDTPAELPCPGTWRRLHGAAPKAEKLILEGWETAILKRGD
jgi:alpha-glucosidase